MFDPANATAEELQEHFYSFDKETREKVIAFMARKPWLRQTRVGRHVKSGDIVFAGDLTRICGFCQEPFSPLGNGKPGDQRFCTVLCTNRWRATVNPHLFRKGQPPKRAAETKEERIARLRNEIAKLEERIAKDKHPVGK